MPQPNTLPDAPPQPRATGSCLCGEVSYEVYGPLRSIIYCHCTQCRRTSGHYVAATAVKHTDIKMTAYKGLRWYHSSDKARRGFCGFCGSSIFWEPKNSTHLSIMAGTLDGDPQLEEEMHIFVANKGSYYTISDHLPQHEGSSSDEP